MFKLAWRNLMEHKMRMLLTSLGIILGVALTLAVGILNQSMLKTFQDLSMMSGGRTDIVLTKNDGFSSLDIRYLKSFDEVELLIPMSTADVRITNSAGEKVEAGVKGIDIKKDRLLRDYYFIEGGWFSGENKREIVIDEKSAAKLGVRYEDPVKLSAYAGEKTYKVIGIIEAKGAGLPSWRPEMYAPLDAITYDAGYPGWYGRLDIDINDDDMIVPAAEKIMKKYGDKVNAQTMTDRLRNAKRSMGGIEMGFSVVLAVVIFVGCFLIYNTFMVIVLERVQQIGILKTLGMDSRQTVRMILVEGVLLGVVGTIVGVGLGFAVGLGLLTIMSKSIGIDMDQFTVSRSIILASIVIGLVMPIVSCLIPARRAAKYMPLEALKLTDGAMNAEKKKKGFLKRYRFGTGLVMFIASLLSFEVLIGNIRNEMIANIIIPAAILTMCVGIVFMTPTVLEGIIEVVNRIGKFMTGGRSILAIKNLMRNKSRTSITVSIIMIGVMVSIGFSGMFNSMSETFASEMEKAMRADIIVQNGYRRLDNFEKIYKQLKKMPEIEMLQYNRFEWYQADDGSWHMIGGVKASEHRKMGYFDLTAGDIDDIYERLDLGEKIAVIGEYYQKEKGYQIGDTIWLKGESRKYPFTVAGIVVDNNQNGRVVYIDRGQLDEMYGGKFCNMLGIKAFEGVDIDRLREKISKEIIKDETVSVATAYEFRETVKKESMSGTEVFDIINIVTLVVALFGLMNTLLMSIFERKREIGMLRSIGSSRSQVRKMIFGESAMMGIYSAATGVVGGWLFAREAKVSMENMFKLKVSLYMPVTYILLAVTAVLFCAFAAAIYPSYMATRTGIVEAIKGE